MPKLETLELEITQSSKTSTTGIKNLATALKALAEAGDSAQSLKTAADALKGISEAAGGLTEASGGIRKVASAMKKLSETLSAAPGSVTGLQRIAEAMAQISEAASGISGVASDIREVNRAARAAGGSGAGGGSASTGGLPSMGDDYGTTTASGEAVEEVKEETKEATHQMEAFRDACRGAGLAIGSFAKRIGGNLWNRFKKNIKESVGGMSQLFASFKRIAMYRGLRTAIKMITQGFATGVKHLYAWADLVGNDFKASMDSIATSANYLKNSLGAMVSPLIDALAPAIDILVDKFVELINYVNQFFATITGASTWRQAVKQQKEYADNTDKAAGAQKRLNHQLMAFDELNNITVNQPSSRGSGNKDDEVDDGSFIVRELPDWAKSIKNAIDKGSWKEAGTLLAEKINGLISGWDAKGWGEALGKKISNGIDFYNGLMDTTDWRGLGGKVADWLDALIGAVSGEDLGHALVAKFNAAIKFLAGFTSEFDWSAAGTWLADVIVGAITGIDWKDFGELIANLAGGILDMLKAAITEMWNHKGDIADAIGDFFSGLFGKDGKGLKNVVELAGWIAGIKLVFGGLKSAFSSTLGGALTSGAAEAFSATGSAATAVKGYMDSFAAKLGLITLVVGLTYVIATSGELNTPEKAAQKVKDENPFFSVFKDGDTDAFKQGFLDALENDPDVKKAYNDNLYQWGKDSVHQDQNAALAAARRAYEQKYPAGSSANWMHTDRSQRTVPEIDPTPQVTALSQIEQAAVNARKKVHELPPTDDEVSKFQDNAIKMAGSKGAGAVTSAAKTARAKVKQISPDTAERTAFRDAMKKESSSTALVTTAANKAGSAIIGITPTNKETAAFNGKILHWTDDVNGIKTAAGNANTAMGKLPSKKSFTYTDTGNGLKNAAKNANTVKANLSGINGKTYKATVKVDTEGYVSTKDKLDKLAGVTTHTIQFKPVIDKGATGALITGSHNTANFSLALGYASGGFPDTGQLFLANEAGPELIGTINGKTAVSSNQEITGIADAVYNTGEEEATLLREQNQLLRQLLSKNTNVSLAPNVAAGRWVAQASAAYNRATGG